MYTLKWIPKETFEGSVTVRVTKHSDRTKLIKKISGEISESGELAQAKIMDTADVMMDFAMSHIESVDLVRKEDQLLIKEAQWLEYDADGAAVLGEIAQTLLNGVKLGKS